MGANLKEVRDRISSVKSTQQITKAMKMVAAAKLRRAQDAIVQMRPYANKLNEMLRNILSNVEGDVTAEYSRQRPIQHVLIVVVTSNRGLCGAFNSNVIKKAVALMEDKYPEQLEAERIRLVTVGKRGFDYFRKRYPSDMINGDYVNLFEDLSFDNVAELSQKMIEVYLEGMYDAMEVVYGEFRNAALQEPKAARFLPVPPLDPDRTGKKQGFMADYIFEPGKEALLKELIPSILQTSFHAYLLDTHASEHGARMTAMDQATENANDLLRDLKISYNKARQEAITKELSEIVGGAAALEG